MGQLHRHLQLQSWTCLYAQHDCNEGAWLQSDAWRDIFFMLAGAYSVDHGTTQCGYGVAAA